MTMSETVARLRSLKKHHKQRAFVNCTAKRVVVRAGRRSGKTTGVGIRAVRKFLSGRRVLYAVPTDEQVEKFWAECKRALQEPLDAGKLYKNETKHIIRVAEGFGGLPREARIRAKTAWDADTLRGDYADDLILDEYQLMKPSRDDPNVSDAWGNVGAPMLLDNDGDATFIYTSKRGKHHSKVLYKRAEADTTGRWAVFHFTSHDNPYLSEVALADLTSDMTRMSYNREILAIDDDDDPRAAWERKDINHVIEYPALTRIVVGVDPPGSSAGAECGIVVAGMVRVGDEKHFYVLSDNSLQGKPAQWGKQVVAAYNANQADRIIGESNFGGEMVEHVIKSVGGQRVAYKPVRASRGKIIRAEPVIALYQNGKVHHVGEFGELEDQMCNWVPGDKSPDRIDALVWALTELSSGPGRAKVKVVNLRW